MLKIGLTGGIGSGKSTVAKVFETLGIPVYSADLAARRIMNEDEQLKANIIAAFGSEAYAGGSLNRPWVASQVFGNKEKLDLLNSLVHPATIADGERWMAKQTTPYAIKEAALIFESGTQRYLDYVVGVSAPLSLRMHRAMKRDNTTREKVEAVMQGQLDESIRVKLCDFIIVNDEQQAMLPQIVHLHEVLLKRSGETPLKD